MSNIDEKFVNLNKDLQDIGNYAITCQRIMAWHEVYFEFHKQLNATHSTIGLDCKPIKKSVLILSNLK